MQRTKHYSALFSAVCLWIISSYYPLMDRHCDHQVYTHFSLFSLMFCVTPLFVSLHWLPVAARIQFKTLMLAYRTTKGSAPTYFHSLLRIYIPSRSLRSASERRLVVPSQRGSKSLSRTFSFTVHGWWNDLPTPIRNAGSLSNFKKQLKTHLFQLYLTT